MHTPWLTSSLSAEVTMPEKRSDLAVNETFSLPSSIFSLVVRECSSGIPEAHVQNRIISAWLWWLFLSQYTFIRAVSLPSGTCMTSNSGGKLTCHLIGWSTFGLNFKILFLLLSLYTKRNKTSVVNLVVSGL